MKKNENDDNRGTSLYAGDRQRRAGGTIIWFTRRFESWLSRARRFIGGVDNQAKGATTSTAP